MMLSKTVDDAENEAEVQKRRGAHDGSRRPGRPSKEQSADLTETILVTASQLFLEGGFNATSMDLIATQTGSSKRTLYARFPSKIVLFEEVVRRFAKTRTVEFAEFENSRKSVDSLLHEIAGLALTRALDPESVALYRLMVSEAYRLPNSPSIDRDLLLAHVTIPLTRIFARAIERGEMFDHDPSLMAEQFVEAVCSREVRRVALGEAPCGMTPERQDRLTQVVDMFLSGIRAPKHHLVS